MTLNTAQKAPVVVTDFYDNLVDTSGSQLTAAPSGVVTATHVAGTWWVYAAGPGTATLTLTKAGTSGGTLEVTVTSAPLTLTLGTPEPK
jgi:hypothetical protein